MNKPLKILCNRCHQSFEYKGSLKGAVEFVKCANIFKINYNLKVLCPNCMTPLIPQVQGKSTVGIPVDEAIKAKKIKAPLKEDTITRKTIAAKAFDEIQKNLHVQKENAEDTEEIEVDEKTVRENKVKEIRKHLIERDSTLVPIETAAKIKLEKKTDKDSKGWHLKISKKQGKLLKKLGFSIIALIFAISMAQILPELFAGKVSYAKNDAKVNSAQYEEDEEISHDYVNKVGALNLKKLGNLLNGKKEEAQEEITKKVPVKKAIAGKSKAFKRYIATLNISSHFGYRKDPFNGSKAYHSGIDIPRRYRSPIKALMDGKVIFSGYKGGYGNLVILKHENGLKTYYGHNAKNTVLKGDLIIKGQIVGYVGMTGRTTGPHLHFEVRKNGIPTDPVKYLEGVFNRQGRVTI